MKSAYELAMERLAQSGPIRHLTDSQREEIAAIDARFKAKIAEREVFLDGLIAAARAKYDFHEVAQLEEQRRREVQKLKTNAEEEKEKVREGK